VGEIAQLRKEDVTWRDGVAVIHITPEAGTVKTNRYRYVPLHSHLIDQGFLDMVASLPAGPLFYDPGNARGGSIESPQADKVGQRLAVWVREMGVTDSRVQPNHGWRHRLKTKGRSAGIPHDALDAIQGHAAGSEGRKYGDHEMPLLKGEIEKLFRYQV
jgi:integrase